MNNETISIMEFLDEHDLELDHVSNIINLIDNVLRDMDEKIDFNKLNEALSLLHFCRNSIDSLKRSATVFWEYYRYVRKCGLDNITLTRYLDCVTVLKISEAPEKKGEEDIKAGFKAYLECLSNERHSEEIKSATV